MLRPLLLLALLAAPARPAAADQVSLTLRPRGGEEARLLSAGLALYALHRRLEDGGSVEQWGRDNAAALRQQGGGNRGLVHQRGRRHEARLDQRGGNNAHAIVQTGRGARAFVEQDGGEVGLTFQHGW